MKWHVICLAITMLLSVKPITAANLSMADQERSRPALVVFASASLSWPKSAIRAEISQYLFRVIPVVDQMPPVSPRRDPIHSSTDGKTGCQKVICNAFNQQMCRWAYASANEYAPVPLEVMGKAILLCRAVGQQGVAGNP